MYINQIYRHANENPDRVAVINSGHEITYAQFACAIEAARNHLMQAGLPDHGVIVRLDRNLYLDWVLLLAVRSFGLTTVSGPSWEAIEHLNLKDITGVVCLSAEESALAKVRSARPDIAIVVLPTNILEPSVTPALPSLLPDSRFGDQIVYTSGTTGTNKKLFRDSSFIEESIISKDFGIAEEYVSEGDIFHCQGFETWSGPGYWNTTVCWWKGATTVFEQRPNRSEHFNDYPVAMTFVVPGQLPMFGKIVSSRPKNFPALIIQTGGGFVNDATVSSIIDTPNVELFVCYGGTEFGLAAMSVAKSIDDLIWLTPTLRPEIEIVDDDDRPVAIGVEGNIRIKSLPTGPTGYLDDAEATAVHFRNGYFYPGDLAVQREDGRIRILGRVQDVLNLGGRKIAAAPVEESIRQSLGLENVCVFAIQDEQGRETLAVVIEARQFPDRATLAAAVGQAVRGPRLRVSKLDRFPRADNGMSKIDRRKVLELARESWSK